MSKVITKGNKRVIAISILNKTYYINILFVNVVAIQYFNAKSSFENIDEDAQKNIKQYIRDLIIKDEHISNQLIEEKIFKNLLPKNLQKKLKSLNKSQ